MALNTYSRSNSVTVTPVEDDVAMTIFGVCLNFSNLLGIVACTYIGSNVNHPLN